MRYFLPYVLSFAIGALALRLILRRQEKIDGGLFLILSAGLGLGISVILSFYGFIFFDRLEKSFILAGHCGLLGIFLYFDRQFFRDLKINFLKIKTVQRREVLILIILILACVPLWIKANFYPFGGWDAWSCWNLKARFLFLGGEDWKNIFNPLLWRSSPHYPLFLPLCTVWGWIFLKEPTHTIPLINALLFTLLTVGFLFFSIKDLTKNFWLAGLSLLLLLTSPFFVTLASSQYSDIVVAFFLLTGLYCLMMARKNQSRAFFFLGSVFLGFLAFTKSEGGAASFLILLLCPFYFSFKKDSFLKRARSLIFLGLGLILSFLPVFLFQFLFAPQNQTFENGFLAADRQIIALRIKYVLSFLAIELTSEKWNGLWIFLLCGVLMAGRRVFSKELRIFPLFLTLYAASVGFYYVANTYFDLMWWLSVTLNRILFSVLPLSLFWVFYSWAPAKKT